MSPDALQVTTSHLRDLAARQLLAAAQLSAAAEMVAGMDHRIRISHGPVATRTAEVIASIQQARRAAAQGAATNSRRLGDDLSCAARAYDATDQDSGARIDRYRW